MNDIEVVTVATHNQGLFKELINNKFGIKVKVLGYGKKWTGFKMKFELLNEYIKNLPDDNIIVFVDGFDTKINGNLEKARDIFIKNNYKVLFSNEHDKYNFILKKIFTLCKNSLIANTGLYMGRVKYLKIIFEKVLREKCKDDQRIINKNCSNFNFIDIDEKKEIFFNSVHGSINTESIFIQYPGSKPGISIFNDIKSRIKVYAQFILDWYFMFLLLVIILLKSKKVIVLLIILNILLFYNLDIDLSCV